MFKLLSQSVTSVVKYVKSAGAFANDLNALKSISRDLSARRVQPDAAGGKFEIPQTNQASQTSQTNQISQTAQNTPLAPKKIFVSQMSFASRADNCADFIEQYESFSID